MKILSFKEFLIESSDHKLRGHWFNHETKELHDVSSDDGPGDHMGWLWATDSNHEKLGVSKEQIEPIRKLFDVDHNPTQEIPDGYHEAIGHILKKNSRITHNNHSIGIDSYDFSPKRTRHIQSALFELADKHDYKGTTPVHWETHNGEYHKSTLDDILTAKSIKGKK